MAPSRLAPIVLLAVALAGCGGADEPAGAPPPKPTPVGKCKSIESPLFRLCGQPTMKMRAVASTIQRRDGSGWRRLAGPPAHSIVDGIPHGYWRDAYLAPDRHVLLAQWSGECEIPIAFFVDAESGELRPVTGEADWREAPESIALGWSRDGRARVRLLKGACGSGFDKPGVYLIDPATAALRPE